MKIKGLLYCVKSKPYLFENVKCLKDVCNEYYTYNNNKHLEDKTLNGKIVAECDFDVEEIFGISRGTNQPDKYDFKWKDSILNGACLTNDQMNDYIPHYAIHIKNLHIFDKPKELSEYHNNNSSPIEKAPQNMMYARQTVPFKKEFLVKGILQEVRGYKVNEYILISIQPQWLCKILNREKTIEVRKKVLKEMLKNE